MGADNPSWINLATHPKEWADRILADHLERHRYGTEPPMPLPENPIAAVQRRRRHDFAIRCSRHIQMIGCGTGRLWAFYDEREPIKPLFEGTMAEVLDAGIRWEANRNGGTL